MTALATSLIVGACSSSDPTLSGASAGAAGSGTAGMASAGKSNGGTGGAPSAGAAGTSGSTTAGTGGSAGSAGATGGAAGNAGQIAGGTGGKAAGGAGAAGVSGGGAAGATAGTGGAGAAGVSGAGTGGAGTAGAAGASGTGGTAGAAGAAGAPACDPTLGADCCAGMTCGTTEGMVCNTGGKCECDLGATDCDGAPENGCEANLLGDGKNCGKCGHDCGGGACSAGLCQPVSIVAATASQLNSGTWDPGSGSVFDYRYQDAAGWLGPEKDPVGGKFQIRTFSLDGTPGAFITNEPVDVPVRAGPIITPIGVVWTESGDLLRRVARSGGAISTIQTGPVTALRMDADSVYILSSVQNGAPNGGSIFKYTKGSLTPTTLYSLVGEAYSDLALDGVGGLYLKCYGVGGTCVNAVYKGSTSGDPLTLTYAAFEGNYKLDRIVARPGEVFGYGYKPGTSPTQGAMIKLDLAGPTRTELIPAGPSLGLIDRAIVDGAWIYFAAEAAIYRVATAGGTPQKLYATSSAWALSQDADYLYFWENGYSRLRKPAPLFALSNPRLTPGLRS